MANEAISYYDPGQNITGRATAAIVGRRFLMVSGSRDTTVGGPVQGLVGVATATAAGRICGVSQADAASGDPVGILRGNSRVVPVASTTAIAAFAEVEVGAAGVAVTKSAGVAVGYAITALSAPDAAAGVPAQISLY